MMTHTKGNPYRGGEGAHVEKYIGWEEGYRYATEKMQGRTAGNPYCIHVKYEADEDSRRRQWKREGWEVGYHSRDAVVVELLEALKVARETIRLWHGKEAWVLYLASPEMKMIDAAIARAGE